MNNQVLNPFLPIDTYIPDGEPHVFGDRIYLFGSHDVVRGNDGRYYLYFNMTGSSGLGMNDMIQVAVCDTPAGKYEYYGEVRNPDGSVYNDYLNGDPAVINDDGIIRLYHGWSLSMVAAGAHAQGNAAQHTSDQTVPASGAQTAGSAAAGRQLPTPGSPAMAQMLKSIYKMLFHRKADAVEQLEYPLMGANTVELEDDMLTVRGPVKRIVPGQFDTSPESSFFGHAFYEASSIRKINGLYYFIYSSENSHELCYARSHCPDRDFVYGGTILSNGDVGYNGRKKEDRLNMTANNHGSLACVNGQWYIFYHRQTHNSTFSRQACAEKIEILKDGSISQAECTSCGLNDGPLMAEGSYQAVYACNITNGHMPHATNTIVNADIPYITNDGKERFITNIKSGDLIGFKYFDLTDASKLSVTVKGGSGTFLIACDEAACRPISGISLKNAASSSGEWRTCCGTMDLCGIENPAYAPLYLKYTGSEPVSLSEITFINQLKGNCIMGKTKEQKEKKSG